MQNYIVHTQHLTKHYGNQMAVQDLTLQVPVGSIYGLLGPNGAGKTTTLKLLMGLLRPDNGEIWIEGSLWQRKALEKIGALIEGPALYGNLTAVENLKVHTLLMGLPDSRIREVLEIVDLTATGKKLVSHFSLGMKQRLGIAIALLGHPHLLILDEPGNGLDPIGIQGLREMIRSFRNQGMTVILSSHILSEIEQVATHVGIIGAGKLLYQAELRPGENLEALFMQMLGAPAVKEESHA